MRIELTIKGDYVPTWGLWQGVRELVQNAKDAEKQHESKFSVTHNGNTLTILNQNIKQLSYETLLLGHTSKADNDSMIGQWGEGMKLGLLALVRTGHSVRIYNGNETWIPALVMSKKFKSKVLSIDIRKNQRKDQNAIRVEVGGVTEAKWSELQNNFLWLRPDKMSYLNYYGKLLVNEEQVGKVYVKGIWVQDNPEYQFGYDYNFAKTDRDRGMVNSWDSRCENVRIWADVLREYPDMLEAFCALAESDAEEIENVLSHHPSLIGQGVIDKLAARFTKRYGPDAVPCSTAECKMEIGHFGAVGIVVNRSMFAMLSKHFGSFDSIKRRLASEAKETFEWCSLNDTERNSIYRAIDLINKVRPQWNVKKPRICEFKSDKIYGQWQAGLVSLARKICSNEDLTLQVLIHEVAHDCGLDGSKSHVSTIEDLWSDIVKEMK